jgi:hypothetical protein
MSTNDCKGDVLCTRYPDCYASAHGEPTRDARIAELTAEVERLTGLADGMYRRGEALLLAVDTFIATYGSEDVALEDLHELTDADAAMYEAMQPYEADYSARTALKDGV